jgi:hypothetical protein
VIFVLIMGFGPIVNAGGIFDTTAGSYADAQQVARFLLGWQHPPMWMRFDSLHV